MENIFKKHWSILTQDPHLSSSLPTVPTFAYRNSISRHFAVHHQKAIADLQVWIIESIPEKFTPAERFQLLCRQETLWIYTLNTMTPHGRNEEVEINTVI